MHIIRNTMLSQNIRYIIPSKMNPVHFRVVGTIIVVALFFFWTVQNHVSSRNNFLFSIKIEMCFSRSNVKKLVIKPTSRPVRWQLLYCVQTVSTAAPYKNRMFFIFKIQACLVPVSGVCIQCKLPPCKYAQFLSKQIVHISKLIKKCIFLCLYLLNYIILCMFCRTEFM